MVSRQLVRGVDSSGAAAKSLISFSSQPAKHNLFVSLFGSAVGTMIGGPIDDKICRKQVIHCSILWATPFVLVPPHTNLFWTRPFIFLISLIMASALPAILVYGQELISGKVAMVTGLFLGLTFGFAGLGAAFLGKLADLYSIE